MAGSGADWGNPPIIGSHHLLASRIRRLEPGARLELRGLGRSLWPVVKSGSRMIVERVDEKAVVRPGQVVVAWLPSAGALVCHVVSGTAPVVTASMFGQPDGEAEVLGQVLGVVGLGRRRFQLLGAPAALRLLRLAGTTARSRGWTRHARESFGFLHSTPLSRKARLYWLEPFLVRRLSSEDLEDLAIFAGHHLSWLPAEWLEAQFRGSWARGSGGAFAAFDRRHHIRAFCFLGRYSDEGVEVPGVWLRSLYTAPIARGLGLGDLLIKARLALAMEQGFHEVHSDILRDNTRSLQLHLKHGFVEIPPEELAPFSPLIERARRKGRELVILRWRSAYHAAR